MKKFVHKIAMCATAVLVTSLARSENYEIVSNTTNAIFASISTKGITPADKIFSNQGTAALMCEVHDENRSVSEYNTTRVDTWRCQGCWTNSTDAAIVIKDITVNENDVTIMVEERFLVYTNVTISSRRYYDKYWNVIQCDKQKIIADQLCEPPIPWTTRGNYAPYCRDEMTNRVEHCENYANVSRNAIWYYDADGDGYATLSRVGIVKSPSGDYLDERADGEYWIMNDVVLVQYTIPRNSYLNYVYGQEDGINHCWRATKAFYKVVLPTTSLKPWWKMPEYQ